jgi:hypothetical protein
MSVPLTDVHVMFRDSSAVEHPTVNRTVPGSNPGRGAIISRFYMFHTSLHNMRVGALPVRQILA